MSPASSPMMIYDAAMAVGIERLSAPVRDFHRAVSPARFAGRAIVERGKGPLAGLIAAIMRLPPASPECRVEVVVTRDSAGTETWSRTFGDRVFASAQELGQRSWSGLIIERIGPMSFAYAVHEKHGELHLDLRGWTALGIPMPRCLGPRAIAFEHGTDGRFNFDVEIGLPGIGRLVRYRGWLVPVLE